MVSDAQAVTTGVAQAGTAGLSTAGAAGIGGDTMSGGATVPGAPNEYTSRMKASLEEYRNCYQGIGESAFYRQQMEFLRTALSFAGKQKLNLVLVNMPLTRANQCLLPAGFYERFCRDMAACAREFAIPYVDLSGMAQSNHVHAFDDIDDFYDSAHLAAPGGKKLVERLVSVFKSQSDLRCPKPLLR